MADDGQNIRVIFEEVLPGNDCIFHPVTIPVFKKFLDETSLDSLAFDKRKREDCRGTSSSDFRLVPQ